MFEKVVNLHTFSALVLKIPVSLQFSSTVYPNIGYIYINCFTISLIYLSTKPRLDAGIILTQRRCIFFKRATGQLNLIR